MGRSPPENLLHGRAVGSEVFLQPSANFNIAKIKISKYFSLRMIVSKHHGKIRCFYHSYS